MDGKEVLRNVRTILLIDWPSKDVPETLSRAGFRVFVHGGPGPKEYSVYEVNGREVVSHCVGYPPGEADLVYSYRPLAELAQTIAEAKLVGARMLWLQSGAGTDGMDDPKGCWMPEDELESAGRQVKAAGLELITKPYIADIAREISPAK